jgi:hypothetical protein
MHPEIENLINMALADDEVTEKERNIILKKAVALGLDQDEVGMILDGKIALMKKEANVPPPPIIEKPKSQKQGDVKKCPSCGAPVSTFSTKCSDCGHEFRNTQVLSSKQRLYEELQKVEGQERSRKSTFTEKIGGEQEILKRINNRLSNAISTFPIPNSKEDLLDFFSLAIAEMKKGGGMHDDGALRKAWKSKAKELKSKIDLDLKNDHHAISLIKEYNLSKKGIILSGKTKVFLIIIPMMIILGVIISIGVKSENKDKEIEFNRIETVEVKIENLINEKKYEAALIQVEKISWTVKPNQNEKLVESTNDKRDGLKKTIKELMNNQN